MPTTSVSSSTASSSCRELATLFDPIFISLCEMMWSSLKRSSRAGLKIWTFCLAICARRSRRMSSSLLPLNIEPAITSIHPPRLRCDTSITDSEFLRASEIFPGLGADADHVAGVDERRDVDDQARFERCGLDLGAGGRALDAGRRVGDFQVDRDRQ